MKFLNKLKAAFTPGPKFLAQAIIIAAATTSTISTWYYYTHGQLNLAIGDALSRLDISRKLIDNIQPGFAQLGNIWLPLPQLLMLPFIWSSWLWHTGIAGALMSGTAFTVAVYFLFRIGRDIFDSRLSGVVMPAIALLSHNLVYIQTTAMSETLFISLIITSMYYLLRWAKTNRDNDLIPAAIFVSLSTLTRFEAYFFAAGALLLVGILSLMRTKSFKKLEGRTIMFATLALTGIGVWMLYLGIIFGDPLYWMHIYQHTTSIVSTDVQAKKELVAQTSHVAQYHNLGASAWSYAEATGFMNGLLLTGLAVISMLVVLLMLFRRKYRNSYLPMLLLPLSIFIFMIYTLFNNGIPLELPALSWTNLWNTNLSAMHEYNIRYGLIMFPAIVLFVGWIASRQKIFGALAIALTAAQLYYLPISSPALTYSLPIQMSIHRSGLTHDETAAADYIKSHYDGQPIMISALTHDPVMFYMGIDYKHFIHEGAGKAWIQARTDPSVNAKWIYMNAIPSEEQTSDSVTKYLLGSQILDKKYTEVFKSPTVLVYERKN